MSLFETASDTGPFSLLQDSGSIAATANTIKIASFLMVMSALLCLHSGLSSTNEAIGKSDRPLVCVQLLRSAEPNTWVLERNQSIHAAFFHFRECRGRADRGHILLDAKLCHAADFFGNDVQMGDPVSLSTTQKRWPGLSLSLQLLVSGLRIAVRFVTGAKTDNDEAHGNQQNELDNNFASQTFPRF